MQTKEAVKTGDIIRLVYYAKVKNTQTDYGFPPEPVLDCEDLSRGFVFSVKGSKLVESVDSADSFTKTEKVSKTKLAEILTHTGDNVFTVEFLKQDGSPRKLRGFIIKKETGLGRSQAIDLDIKRDPNASYDNRIRQIDHRTLTSLIYNGTKYLVK